MAWDGWGQREAASKHGQTPPPTFLEAPQEIHYYVTRKQPVNLTWVATNVCKMQIKCNNEKFRDGNNRVCKQTCKECKTRRRTKIVKVKDFPEGVRSMTCQCKVWGTKVIKAEKIIVEKAFLRRNFTVFQSLHVVPPNATVILPCKPPHGEPRPEITWYKNGEPFSPERGRQVIFPVKNTVKLELKHVSANDSGEYRCVAMNMAARREGPILRLEVRALLIVGTEDALLKIDLRNTSRRTQLQVKNVMSLDFSSDKNLVYWSNKKEIKQLSLQTGISEVIPFHHNDYSSVPFPEGLAVDWISGKLYWTDAKRDAIYVGDLRNGRKMTIIEGKIDSPKAIVVSPSNGYIYWTNWGQAPHIERARLDGTERRALVYNGIKFPKGLALDELGKKLFWAGTDDNKHGIIEAVSLDGLNRSVIFYEQGYHPFCLDTFEDYVYWADLGRNAILRIKSLGGEAEVIIDGLNKPMGLKILHPRESRPGNSCDKNNGDCEYLCLSILEKQRCFCKEGMKLKENGKNCEKYKLQGEEKNGESLDFNTPIFIIVMLLLLLVAVYFALKKRPSCSRPTDPPRVPRAKRANDQGVIDEGIEEELPTDQTELMVAESQPNDASPESNQQLCSSEASGACASPVKRDVVVHMHMNTLNMNTVNT
ncbi:unnamed protein product [Porites evermanni]|uniref:Ig-like domain-containing protein n=1 Tax=Porites evermanni TaxID=104178 RepID=A0ABN8LIY2_9CNID|nr:unnamed protein product [Porites evermanni]